MQVFFPASSTAARPRQPYHFRPRRQGPQLREGSSPEARAPWCSRACCGRLPTGACADRAAHPRLERDGRGVRALAAEGWSRPRLLRLALTPRGTPTWAGRGFRGVPTPGSRGLTHLGEGVLPRLSGDTEEFAGPGSSFLNQTGVVCFTFSLLFFFSKQGFFV